MDNPQETLLTIRDPQRLDVMLSKYNKDRDEDIVQI